MSDEKERIRQLEKQADEKFAIAYRKEIEQIMEEAIVKDKQRKKSDRDHCILLKEQIKARAGIHEDHMTNTEKSINREVS